MFFGAPFGAFFNLASLSVHINGNTASTQTYSRKGHIMRKLILLAFGLISIILSGCGVASQIAKDTCNQQTYNIVVCPGLLDRLVETPVSAEKADESPAAAPTTKKAKCVAIKTQSVRSRRARKSTVLMSGTQGCSEIFPVLRERLEDKPKGSECIYVDGDIECAGMEAIGLFLLLHLLLGLAWPRRESAVAIALLTVLLLCVHSQAYGACTPNEEMSNRVAAQYGYVMYDCSSQKKEAQLDVSASIRKHFKVNNEGRLTRIEKAFQKVWGDAPLEVQKLALSVCLKETGCGFSQGSSFKQVGGKIVFSHHIWEREVYMSHMQACGLVQVDTRGLQGECARLNGSFEYAFRAQRRWLEKNWRYGPAGRVRKIRLMNPSQWLQPIKRNGKTTYLIYRYAGKGETAYQYGRIAMNYYHALIFSGPFQGGGKK